MRLSRCATAVCSCVGAVLLACGAARAQGTASTADTASARRALVELEQCWLGAHDSATLGRILGADFVHPVASGDFLTKSQHIAWVVAHPPDSTIERRLADLRVRFYGQTGIVTGAVIRSRAGSELGRNVFTDVFVHRDGRWQAVSAEETPVSTRRAGPPG